MTDPAQAERDFDSTVLRLLLDASVPWSIEEIVRELQDPDARDSVARLASAGLINRTGELVFPGRLELAAGASRRPRRHDGLTVSPTAAQRAAERELQSQAEQAYRRLVADWQAAAPKGGVGATPGRASSNRPSKGKAARQATSP